MFAINNRKHAINPNAIVGVATIELKHTYDHIESFFTSFHNAHTIPNYPPIALLITSKTHAIAAFFDQKNLAWKIIDANSLPTKTFRSELMLTKKIMHAFSHSKTGLENNTIKIRLFTTLKNHALAESAISLLSIESGFTVSKYQRY